jgi:HK97 gp10 family phage protein
MANGGMKLEGDKALERKLRTLGDRVQRRVLRSAVNASASPVVKAAKRKAKKQSGTLKKSLGKKVLTNKKHQSVTALVGPRKGVQGTFKGKVRKPSRYAHLVEKGFIDEHGNHHAPQPFLNPAMQETQGEALGIMKSKLAEGVAKEAAKGAS